MLTYAEIDANLTWYKLNSNFKDSMYQYMLNLSEEWKKTNIPKTSYIQFDSNFVLDQSSTLRYGNLSCHVQEKKQAFLDSSLTCFLFQLPFFLENNQFGYICLCLIFPIMLISIFGKIKETYRWYILNQACWDLLVCYDFICAKPTLVGWFTPTSKKASTCFYYIPEQSNNDGIILITAVQVYRDFLQFGAFFPIFFLAFSRFFSMYFTNASKKFFKNGYQILAFFVTIYLLFAGVLTSRRILNLNKLILHSMEQKRCRDEYCYAKNEPNLTKCLQNNEEYFQCMNFESVKHMKLENIGEYFVAIVQSSPFVIAPLMFLLTNLCVGLLFWKIAKQLKFQLKTNRHAFIQTIKISAVVGFQCLFLSILFITTGLQRFLQIKASTSEYPGDNSIYLSLSPWIFFLQYETTTASLNMIRIFLDSFIVLSILTGYSTCVLRTFKFLYLLFSNPKNVFKRTPIQLFTPSNSINVNREL